VNLAIFFVCKLVLLSISGLMLVPAGLYIPLLAVGGAFGRIIGEVLQIIEGD